jgi:hypothetical protein
MPHRRTGMLAGSTVLAYIKHVMSIAYICLHQLTLNNLT